MNYLKLVVGVLFIVLNSNSIVLAQKSSFEEFEAKVKAAAGEIEKYQRVLQNPDVRIQYQAVQFMLKSRDPALQRIAKEHALFSTNPVLRNSSIKAILDAGGNIRLQITSIGEASADVFRWLAQEGGSHDGRTGSLIFKIGPARENCWIHYNDYCRFQLSGTDVLFRNHGSSSNSAQASLKLGNDGVLRGIIFSGRNGKAGKAQLSIDLKE